MNKNLEEAYINSIESSAPDLWGRISAKIDAFEAENMAGAQESTASGMADHIVPFKTGQKKTKSKTFMKRYGGILVAAAALVIAIPVVLLVTRNGGRKSMNTAQAVMATEEVGCAAPMTEETMFWDSEDVAESAACEEPSYSMEEDVCMEADNSPAMAPDLAMTEKNESDEAAGDSSTACQEGEYTWSGIRALVLDVGENNLTLFIEETYGADGSVVFYENLLENVACPAAYLGGIEKGDYITATLTCDEAGKIWEIVELQ